MNLWLGRLKKAELKDKAKVRRAKMDKPKKRRGRKPKLPKRWHPLPEEPCDPPYIPKLGHTVRIRMRTGTVEQYEEVVGEVQAIRPLPEHAMMCILVRNCVRLINLWWKGTKWECHAGPFYFEIEVTRIDEVKTGRYEKSEHHEQSARLKAQRDAAS